LDQPIDALPLRVFRFAISPSLADNRAAWGASLILVVMMLGISIASRAVIRLRAVKR
jgi:ABC-type phosphate transport system permease subunit